MLLNHLLPYLGHHLFDEMNRVVYVESNYFTQWNLQE